MTEEVEIKITGLVGFLIFADYFNIVDIKKDQSELMITNLIKERDYYGELYKNCSSEIADIKTDISLLKANIQLVGALGSDMPFPMWLKDKEGRMIWLNKAYEDVFLLPFDKNASDYIGNTDYQIWSKEIADQYVTNDRKALSSSEPIIRTEIIKIGNIKEEWVVIKYRRVVGNTVVGVAGFCYRK